MSQTQNAWMSMLPFVVLIGAMYFMMVRPQMKQQKKRQEMLTNLKTGDRIMTVGGIYGTITKLDSDTVMVRIADKVEIKLVKTGISQVINEE
ncbi:MAG: preprotein translocase subunit YajC [Bacillota bacterium]